ncbi:MAG TPA: HAD-IA family hydrolase [Vicinamibacterales bacterium]|nr:HAD-IA family hydrolase [Vicinamibacterales bacterium]
MGHIHRLIAFDLDGTLIDSRRDLADSANALIVEYGGAPLSEAAIGRMVGDGAALLVRRALDAAGLGDQSGALARFLEIYDTGLLNHTRLYDGVADVVRRARRHARVTLLTNKPTRASERILDGLGVRDLFDEVVGGDSPYPRKPDPSALVAMMRAADATPERTLFIGDSAIDLETARRAGVGCCLVSFGFGNLPREPLGAGESVVEDAAGLAAAIDRFTADGTGTRVRDGTGT